VSASKPEASIHFGAGLYWRKATGAIVTMLAGWPVCCSGARARKIANRPGALTRDAGAVTCKACLLVMSKSTACLTPGCALAPGHADKGHPDHITTDGERFTVKPGDQRPKRPETLPPRQRAGLAAICAHMAAHNGQAPTTKELAEALGLNAGSTWELLKSLEHYGAIKRWKGAHRAIEIVGPEEAPPAVPAFTSAPSFTAALAATACPTLGCASGPGHSLDPGNPWHKDEKGDPFDHVPGDRGHGPQGKPDKPSDPWKSTPASKRKAKPLNTTLEPEARERLERLAAEHHGGKLGPCIAAALKSYEREGTEARDKIQRGPR
jgi:hypothetical protein